MAAVEMHICKNIPELERRIENLEKQMEKLADLVVSINELLESMFKGTEGC